MFSFQGASLNFPKETQWSFFLRRNFSQFLWWRLAGSNRWPPACKAGALPAELTPHLGLSEVVGQDSLSCGKATAVTTCHRHVVKCRLSSHFCISASQLSYSIQASLIDFSEVVGQNGLEPSTSRLSVVCSSQLSYWPISASLLL